MLITTVCYALMLSVGAKHVQKEKKIIGGAEVNIANVPYMISIKYEGAHICGGAIVSKYFVLTTAHCFDGVDLAKISIDAGSSINNQPLQSRNIYKYKIHDDYDIMFVYHDIAILQVNPGFVFGKTIRPAKLPADNEHVIFGQKMIVSGWGQTQESGKIALKLRSATIPIISNNVCKEIYRPMFFEISDLMICAGFLSGGTATCKGDSGGPLVSKGKLYGLTSFSLGCGRKNFPAVFTNVLKYRDWIRLYSGL